MTDEQPTGGCCCCARRDPETGYACRPCRSRLASWLREIPGYVADLIADDEPMRSGGRGGPVSGTKERRLPIAVDRTDLLAPARFVWLDGEDQVGYVSVASTLDFWVRDWAEHRDRGEHLPPPAVADLCSWLLDRYEEACDDHPAIDEMFDSIRQLRGALMAQLGLFDVPDYKQGIPCRCGMLTLVRHNGCEYVECSSCGLALTTDEYDQHVADLLAEAKQRKKEAA